MVLNEMTSPTLVRRQPLDASHSVTVWKQGGQYNGQPAMTYLKVWEGRADGSSAGWLSWGLHEQLLLTLLAGRGVRSAVTTLGLNQDTHRIELSTLDAGPELQQDWLDAGGTLLSDTELVKLGYHALRALLQIHQVGVVHGDLKADNICVSETRDPRTGARCVDWRSLKLIDFAFSLSRDNPLHFVLPIDTRKIDYHPEFYRQAVEQSQQSRSPVAAQAACSAAIDLYSLGVMLQKQVARAERACPGASALAKACLKAGARQKPWHWPWSDTRFEAQTLRLEQKALQWLRSHGLSEEDIARSAPVDAEASVTSTPLRAPAQATPLAPVQATPLAVAPVTPLLPPSPVAAPLPTGPSPVPSPAPAPEPVATPSPAVWFPVPAGGLSGQPLAETDPAAEKRPWARWYWIGVTLLLALCFVLIDRGYRATGLILSNTGYFTALLAILAALPLVRCAMLQVSRPTRTTDLVCIASALFLTGVAFLHGASVMQAGLRLQAAWQIVFVWLLTLVLVARRANGMASTPSASA